MRTHKQEPVLLRIPEAAEVLAIGRSTVYELIADGRLETVHIGRSVRVTSSSIEAFIDAERSCQQAQT